MPSNCLIVTSHYANTAMNACVQGVGQQLHDAFANAGWVQISDSGDVSDWSAVAANGTIGASFGYEIWRMNDALANDAPVYLKWEFVTMQTTNGPAFKFTLGDGSDGAGSLTGGVSGPWSIRVIPSSTGNSLLPCYFRGNPNDMSMAMWCNSSISHSFLFNIERTKDANGNDTADGVILQYAGTIYNSTTADWVDQVWFPKVGSAPFQSTIGVFLPTNNVASSGLASHYYPIYPYAGILLNPMLNLIVSSAGMAAVNVPFDITFYGATHRYVWFTNMDEWTNRCSQTSANWPVCFRWE